MHETVKLALGERSYDIVIGQGAMVETGDFILALGLLPRVFIVTDEQVAKHHLPTLEASLTDAGIRYNVIVKPAGEQTKCFAELESLLETLLSHKPERGVTLIALGGGVIGDLTGFSASVLLRGVNFIQIPTTLLAMVDSSVGGKTGINSQHGKNLIGSFYQPKQVIIDTNSLITLPRRELLSGYAEVVKYGLIRDAAFFAMLEEKADLIASGALLQESGADLLRTMIMTSCRIKAEIVAEDEREGGVRALLNLGHTFGHALERATGYCGELLHGEAVAIGMVLAFALSVRMKLCPAEDAQRVKAHLAGMGLKTSIAELSAAPDPDALLDTMYGDKKVKNGALVFILAHGIGKGVVYKDVNPDDVLAVLKEDMA